MNSKYKSVKDDALESICINNYLNRDPHNEILAYARASALEQEEKKSNKQTQKNKNK